MNTLPPTRTRSLFEKKADDTERLVARVTKILFQNPDNGFVICRMTPRDRPDEIVAAGNLFDVRVGEDLDLTGVWQSGKHGLRFTVTAFEPVLPSTPAGIARYLASGVVPGIGKVMADRIVKALGPDTLRILDDDPRRLMEVPGIGPKRGEALASAWNAKRRWREMVVFLQSVGVSATLAPKIVKAYGEDAFRMLQRNPYELALDVRGIGFLTADRIARSLGIAEDSVERAQAAIIHLLTEATDDGHTALPAAELITRCRDGLNLPEPVIDEALTHLQERGLVVADRTDDGPIVFLAELRKAEVATATGIARRLGAPSRLRAFDADKAIAWYEQRHDVKLTQTQARAVITAIRSPMLVITGGPGTGKTTIVRAIVEIAEGLKGTVVLAAPTGRAAKQLAESCDREAKTLHRLLELRPGASSRRPAATVESDILIVDESGMIDVPMAATLLGSLSAHTHLVLVGDVDQLPSVGPGSLLRDIIVSERVPVVRLHEIFRQHEHSLIVANAHSILAGQAPELPDPGSDADFYFIRRDNAQGAQNLIVDLVRNRLPEKFGLDPMRDIQVLTPMHKGDVGVKKLNECLQRALNPTGPSIERPSVVFRLGDRVLQTANDYDRGVYNGDLGRITHVDTAGRFLNVDFDGVTVKVEGAQFDDLALAYAMSIHKSQGSEYPAVVIALSTQHFILLQRNLLYTAVTRARRLVIIVGSPRALDIAVKNDEVRRRFGLLCERLQRSIPA